MGEAIHDFGIDSNAVALRLCVERAERRERERNNNRFLMISWFGKSERDIIEGIGCEFNNLFLF